MAKFGRYDPRNKKKDRNKKNSLEKDQRIKTLDNETKLQGYSLNEVMYDEYEGVEDDVPKQLNG
jgi:hypothetical protein